MPDIREERGSGEAGSLTSQTSIFGSEQANARAVQPNRIARADITGHKHALFRRVGLAAEFARRFHAVRARAVPGPHVRDGSQEPSEVAAGLGPCP